MRSFHFPELTAAVRWTSLALSLSGALPARRTSVRAWGVRHAPRMRRALALRCWTRGALRARRTPRRGRGVGRARRVRRNLALRCWMRGALRARAAPVRRRDVRRAPWVRRTLVLRCGVRSTLRVRRAVLRPSLVFTLRRSAMLGSLCRCRRVSMRRHRRRGSSAGRIWRSRS